MKEASSEARRRVDIDEELYFLWSRLTRGHDSRALAGAAFVLGSIAALMYGPFKQPEGGDSAIYDYIAQTILRGGLPYRDVVEIKGPGAIYLSALAMALARFVGMRDVIAVRMLHILMLGVFCSVTYLVAEAYLKDRLAAVISFLIPLMMSHFPIMMNGGTQPKLPMMIFGLVSLLLIAKDRPFWAGVGSMLSCLCWQPGLLFTGVAFLMFTRYMTRWRDLRWLKVLAGAALPLAITLLYFRWRGALGDLWSWTVTFNYSVFAPEGEKPVGEALQHIWNVLFRVLRWDVALVGCSLAGAALFAVDRVRERTGGAGILGTRDLFRDGILIPPVVYFLFCLINFQAGPDLIPFFPFFGIFGAFFLVRVGKLKVLDRRVSLGRYSVKGQLVIAELAIVIILLLALGRAATYRVQGWTLGRQVADLRNLSGVLGPNDKIYVHGTVELLVLLGIPNLNPYVAYDSGADDYIAAKRAGGFDSVIQEIESQKPKIVAMSRLRNVRHRADLMLWVQQHYDKVDAASYESLYIRRP